MVGENRNLATAPDFRTTPLKDIPKMWNQYFRDKMPFRQVFMPGYLFIYEKVLKTYVSEFVTGYDNEIFMNHAEPLIDRTLGVRPYPVQAKEHVRLTAAGKYAYFLSKDIPYYLFLAPDKTTIYPEFLPFYANWIPHRTWYQEQVATLTKAHIKFFPLNDCLSKFKKNERQHDIVFDNGHWNGNALVHAYQYMAGILSQDNPIFSPVKYNEYYSVENVPVTSSVYGSEITSFIRLKHKENFSCSILPEQYRTMNYNKFCINNAVPKGSLWFFSDSYFGGTHGSDAVTPFIHNVHTYIHRHADMGDWSFTQLANRTMSLNKPDAVIEEFVERMTGAQHSLFDPMLRILGDYWMKTGGIFLEHKTDFSKFNLHNIERNRFAHSEFTFKADNKITLKAPVVADDLGRVVIMGQINAPSNISVRIIYSDENSTEKTQDIGIAQGSQLFHETIHTKPFSQVNTLTS